MKKMSRAWAYALCLVLVMVGATGCTARGGMSNPGWTVVSAADDVVYAALPMGQVVALDANAEGAEMWMYPVKQERSGVGGIGALFSKSAQDADQPLDAVYGAPIVKGDLLLVSSYNHNLYAFDRASGDVVWGPFAAEEAIIGGVSVYDNVAYFGSSDYKVYAVDVETGQAVWDEPFATGHWVWGRPAVDADYVYVGSMDRNVYAIDRATGQQAWQQPVGGSVPGTVTLSDGLLFVGGVDKQLHALDKNDGSEVWSQDLGHWVWGEALVQDNVVYAGSLDGKLHALGVEDGAPQWNQPAILEGALRAGPVSFGEQQLIVGTEAGIVYTIDTESGEVDDLYTVEGAVLSTPAVVDDTVYVGTAAGIIYALDTAKSGDLQVWRYPPAKK